MSDSNNIISIKVLDRTYNIKCPAEEAQRLQESAKYVDEQMRKIRQSGSVVSTDRVAVVAALNICNELLVIKKQQNQQIELMNQHINDLQTKIQDCLATAEEVSTT